MYNVIYIYICIHILVWILVNLRILPGNSTALQVSPRPRWSRCDDRSCRSSWRRPPGARLSCGRCWRSSWSNEARRWGRVEGVKNMVICKVYIYIHSIIYIYVIMYMYIYIYRYSVIICYINILNVKTDQVEP